jgi:2-polyprenyl-3-methyl-5-hydroxy-6-metoxy-1,4-benzoquinol methylase
MQTEHIAELERRKYERAWAIPEYSNYSPGVSVLPLFRQMVKPRKRGSLIDIGAGTGKASMMLADDGWDVTMLDHVRVTPPCPLPFVEACVFQPWPTDQRWDVGFSCDVLEHIPPDEVDPALDQILRHCRRAFFSINFLPDHFGQHVGSSLHLTVQPFEWWVAKLREHAPIRNARDILGEGVFYVGR